MSDLGKWLIIAGIVLIVIGLAVSTDWLPLGRLPGDVRQKGEGFSVYFPWVSCLVASALASLLLWLLRK